MLTLAEIARALDGKVSGRQVIAPGPSHSRNDGSLSIWLGSKPPGFTVHSHSGDDWQSCKDYVSQRLGIHKRNHAEKEVKQNRAESKSPRDKRAAAPAKPPDTARKAAWLWGARAPIAEGCPAWLYLRRERRHDGPIPRTLGYLPANGKHPPAMVAAFGFCHEPEPGVIDPPSVVNGVHITRLAMDGRKAPIDPVKIMLGPSAGLPIVLAPANDGLGLAITEGIEDGLSVFEETGLGVWAAGSAGNMPKIAAALPPYVECAMIFAHCDEAGLRFGKEAARLIAAKGVEVHLKGLGFHPVETPSDIGPLEACGDD